MLRTFRFGVGVQQVQAEVTARTIERSADELDEIIYHITHDLRASLRALKSLPGWLREDLTASGPSPSTSVLEILGMIEEQAERADTMLLDLRTFSRIGRVGDEPAMIPFSEAIDAALERVKLPAGFSVTRDIRLHSLRAPRNELRELLFAVFSNAVKHHDRDSGTIAIEVSRHGGNIVITVEDDGPGIPEQFCDRVFEMMATLRARDDCPGSGLGLSIARKIVERLDGSIKAMPAQNDRGTCITIRLPEHLAGPTSLA